MVFLPDVALEQLHRGNSHSWRFCVDLATVESVVFFGRVFFVLLRLQIWYWHRFSHLP